MELIPFAFERADGGAEIRRLLGIPATAHVIGTAGRLSEVKRQDLLIRAFAKLRKDHESRDVHLLIVGEGDERKALVALSEDLGISNVVHFPGYSDECEPVSQCNGRVCVDKPIGRYATCDFGSLVLGTSGGCNRSRWNSRNR